MEVSTRELEELTPDEAAFWDRCVAPDGTAGNAFTSRGFARAADAVRRDVEVLVARRHGALAAILPLHRRRTPFHRALGLGHRVGGILSDAFGPVVDPEAPAVVLDDLLAGSTFNGLHFSHLLPTVPTRVELQQRAALAIDLEDGFDAYWSSIGERDRKFASDTLRRESRLQSKLGPTTFRWHDDDPAALEHVVRMKSAQYERTGRERHPFSDPDNVALLRALHRSAGDPLCEPVLSVLTAGSTWVGSHFGIRCRGRLHYWFPVYNPDLRDLAPGRMVLLQVLRAAGSHGVRIVDRGEGDQAAKRDFANRETTLGKGTWYRRGPTGGLCAVALAVGWRVAPDAVAT